MNGNLSDLLRKAVSSEQLDLIHRVADEASALGFPIYIVGGFVRDLLLGHPSLDFDLVVEGDAIKLADILASKYGGKVTIHPKFRTAKWFLDKDSFMDLISARSEIYQHPAALPTVNRGSISDDLRRRDFTINTLAIRLDNNHFGELHDELGGLDDLRQGSVRVLHPRLFVDDPTRMFRAVRYEQRYDFKIAKETSDIMPDARGLIEKLSPQRVRHELDLILDEPNAASMLARLRKLGLLEAIHSSLYWDKSARERFEASAKTEPHVFGLELSNIDTRDVRWLLWLMTLSTKEVVSLNNRLHFTAALLEALRASLKLFAGLSVFARLKPSQCVERLEKLPLLSIYAVTLAAPRGKPKQALEKYLTEWRHVKPKTTGGDLKKLGIEPGPNYQVILRRLRNAWLDGTVKSLADEQTFLEKILN